MVRDWTHKSDSKDALGICAVTFPLYSCGVVTVLGMNLH